MESGGVNDVGRRAGFMKALAAAGVGGEMIDNFLYWLGEEHMMQDIK